MTTLENPQLLSLGISNEDTGMLVWVYPEKTHEPLGAVRWLVSWHEAKPGMTANEEDSDVDFDDRYTCHAKAFTAEAAARRYAQKVFGSRPLFFGVVEIQRQCVDWFVEEDGVAEWADVGDAETVE